MASKAPIALLASTLSDRTDCDAAMLSAKLVKNAELKIYKGAPHGMCTTEKDKVNQDLLAFIGNAKAQRAA